MLTTFNINSEELTRLNYERYHYPCAIVQKRLHCLYLKAMTTYSNGQIGLLMDAHRNSISQWVQQYLQEGFDAITTVNYGTNSSKLDLHASSILQAFERKPPRSLAEAGVQAKELTGIQRSTSSLHSFMKRHGLKFLKTGHIPAKADTAQQQQWVAQTLQPVIEAAKQGEVHLLFLDAVHFVLQPFLCCLWCIARLFIKAASGRNRINVIGAVNAITHEVLTYTNTTYICANCLVTFLQQIKERYSDKPIAIVLDNARYQHCFLVRTFAKSLGIHLLFLPPYSPNLNIIERLWKFTKKKILYAAYYDSPAKFHQAIIQFFNNIHQQKDELQKLLTLKFQFFDNSSAHFYPE